MTALAAAVATAVAAAAGDEELREITNAQHVFNHL